MTVYVDDSNIQAAVKNGSRVHRSKWCHLMADDTEELVTFAKSIGLKPEWIQNAGRKSVHFDLTESKRRAAVRAGAVEVAWKDLAIMIVHREWGGPLPTPEVAWALEEML